jgi:DNA repair photolyase
MGSFNANRQGTGTREWSEISYNIQTGCQHGCLYCYAKERMLRFKKISTHEEWQQEKIRMKAVNRKWAKMDGVIMFPTTHDITPNNVQYVITTLKNMLEPGNSVLIVSKPHLDCIKLICQELAEYKNQILFRFTIGCFKEGVSGFWEPNAPLPGERLRSLRHAFEKGFQTSVSMEPMLEGCTEAIITFEMVKRYVTDAVWIGKMNKIRTRVDMSDPDNKFMVGQVEQMQCDEEIIGLVKRLQHEPKVRWKDSIKRIIEKGAMPM